MEPTIPSMDGSWKNLGLQPQINIQQLQGSFALSIRTHTKKNANLQKKNGATSKKRDKNLFPSGAGSKPQKNNLCLHRPAPRWAHLNFLLSEWETMGGRPNGQGFWPLRYGGKKFGLVGWKLDSKTGRCRNVVSYLQPSKQILFGSKPKHTWPGETGVEYCCWSF